MSFTSYTDQNRNKYVSLLLEELSDEKKSRLIEKSVYNYTILYSKGNNIKRNWDNLHFKRLYLSKIRPHE